MFFGVATLDYFNFDEQGSKVVSSDIRRAKIERVFQVYLNNSVLGIGYGASGVIDDKREVRSSAGSIDAAIEGIQANAETTPYQILAETGTLGGVVSLFMLVLASERILQILRDKTFPGSVKMDLLVSESFFICDFLGADIFSSVPFNMALPFILGRVAVKH